MKYLLLSLLLAACVTQPASNPSMHTSSSSSAVLADAPCPTAPAATLNATLWMQTSAEHDALLTEIYGMARRQLDEAVATPAWTALDTPTDGPARPPAVILDLDETAIDTSASTARLVKKGATYTEAEWNTFALAGNSRALAPALDFLRYASSRGVAIFYITNRIAAHEPALHRNLAALGFPLADQGGDDPILTRGERPDWNSGDKSSRRAFVGQHYRVIMLFGDDLNDFAPAAGKTLAERNEIVRSHTAWWGSRWFALPNPMYGSWERALTGDAKGGCAQLQRKLDALRTDETYVPGDRAAVPDGHEPLRAREEMARALAAAIANLPAFHTLVAGPTLDPEAGDAAASIRTIVPIGQLPQSETESLPSGYARLDRLEVHNDTAHVVLWYGPVPKAQNGVLQLNCGTGNLLELHRGAGGVWNVTSRGLTVC